MIEKWCWISSWNSLVFRQAGSTVLSLLTGGVLA